MNRIAILSLKGLLGGIPEIMERNTEETS